MQRARNLLFISLIIFFWGLHNGNSQNFAGRLDRVSELTDSLRYDRAIGLLHELLQDARRVDNDSMTVQIQIKLGSAYVGTEKNRIGIKYYKDAQALAVESNDLKQIANTNYGLGAAFQQLEKYDSSKRFYQKAVSYFSDVNDSLILSYLFSNLSLLHYKLKQPDSMQFYSNVTLNIQLRIGDKYGSGASYANLGLIAKDKGKFEEAVKFYRASLEEYREVGFLKGYSETLRALGISHYLMESLDSSAYFFYVYDSIGHDVFHQDNQDKILELETKFKTAEFERDNALKQAEIEQNQQQLTILYIIIGSFLIISICFYWFVMQRRKYIKAASDKKIEDLLQQQEIQATYALLEGQDKERKRIAIELHDNLGSILTSLNMFSDALQARIDPDEIKKIANRISDTSALANEEIRKISHSLDSGLLKHFGLEAAIKQLIEAVESAKAITFDLDIQVSQDISNENGLEVYRIIQELVNNALKHSQCSKIRLEVNQIGEHMSIIFEDNGVGFETTKVGAGMGLNNIYKRAEKLNGEFTIESTIGKGSTFIIELPHI